MRKTLVFVVFFLLLPLLAHPLDFPRGPVLLTISGTIKRTNSGNHAVLDAAILKSLPQHTLRTDTPWTDGITTFEGPLLQDVIKLVGGEGQELLATALNDYVVSIPRSDIENHGVILAMKRNGLELTVRSKGPLWVIYPWKTNEKLRTERYYSRSIWHLSEIEIR